MARQHPPAFQFYPDDFASDGVVEAMTTEEVGAYILILCKAWRETPVGSLPNDDRVLARWARLTPARWAACRNGVLAAFIELPEGRFLQKRMNETYNEMSRRSEAKGKSGKAGAKKRWDSRPIGLPSSCHESAIALPMANDSSASATASASAFQQQQPRQNDEPAWGLLQSVGEFMAVWNANPYTRKALDTMLPSKNDMIARLANPAWIENYPKALAKLPLKSHADDPTISIDWFLKEDTVPLILAGKFDFPGRKSFPAQGAAPARLPTLAESRAARGKQ